MTISSEVPALYQLFFDAMPGHSYIHRPSTHPDNGLLLYSPQLEAVIGYPADVWVNDRAFREHLVHPDDRTGWRAAYAAVTPATMSFAVEFRINAGDGAVRWIRDQAKRVTSEAGEDFWLGFLADISAEKEAEMQAAAAHAALAHANAELTRQNEARREFVAMVGHELRTPLTSIQGFSELLLDGGLSPAEATHFTTLINSSAEHLGRLIHDVLDADVVERTPYQRSLLEVDVSGVARDVVRQLHFELAHHQVHTELIAGTTVCGNQDALARVVTNLLTNAVKYSPRGSTIVVTTARSAATATLRVTDEGFGIPAADRERVFTRFGRLHRPEYAAVSGIGLGLSMTRDIVTRHGGRIWMEGNTPMGTVACVEFPRLASDVEVQAVDLATG